jgi:hypothetical protein
LSYKQYTTDKVVVVKKNKGKLEITQGQVGNLTGNLEVQVIGHGEQVDGINKLLFSGAMLGSPSATIFGLPSLSTLTLPL